MIKNKFIIGILILGMHLQASTMSKVMHAVAHGAQQMNWKQSLVISAVGGFAAYKVANTETGKRHVKAARHHYKYLRTTAKNMRGIEMVLPLYCACVGGVFMRLGFFISHEHYKKDIVRYPNLYSVMFAGGLAAFLLHSEWKHASEITKTILQRDAQLEQTLKIRLEDIKGSQVPAALTLLVDQIKSPAKYNRLKKSDSTALAPRRALFYGPEGVGKKYLAQATAASLGVKYVTIRASDLSTNDYRIDVDKSIKETFAKYREIAVRDPKKLLVICLSDLHELNSYSRGYQALLTELTSPENQQGQLFIICPIDELLNSKKHEDSLSLKLLSKYAGLGETLKKHDAFRVIEIKPLSELDTIGFLSDLLKEVVYEHEHDKEKRDAILKFIAEAARAVEQSTPTKLKICIDKALEMAGFQGKDSLTDEILKQAALVVFEKPVAQYAPSSKDKKTADDILQDVHDRGVEKDGPTLADLV